MGDSHVRKVRLFVASPGDVKTERESVKDVVDGLERTVARDNGITLELVLWESHARPEMDRPQGVINRQLGKFDVFISIMWRRFGTPSGKADSGTEEEIQRAHRSFQETGSPKMLCYFSMAPAPPPVTVDEAEQLLRVVKLRDEMSSSLFWTYDNPAQFKDFLREHLHRLIVDELVPRAADADEVPIEATLQATLDATRDFCLEEDVGLRTPQVLLALFNAPGGVANRSFDLVRDGLADRIRETLTNYVDRTVARADRPRYEPIEWSAREEVRDAFKLAEAEGCEKIWEKHLLLAVLSGRSATVANMKNALFPGEDFDRLVAAIRLEPADGSGGIMGTADAPSW